jgi:raffinose/stachyose/melibiose transport system substrate-binding protein
MLTPTKRVAALTTAFMSALALSACGDDGGGGSEDGDTLTLWHYEGPDSAMGKAWAAAIEEFEDTHEGVTVEFEEKGFEQIQKTAPMVLNSDDAPDLMEYNKGNATAGLLAKQGLLTDLSAEAAERGWEDMLSPSVQTTSRYENGIMGSGAWYGIPNYAEYVMVYYNVDLFEEHGVEVPATYDDFVAAMDTFAGKGMTPLAMAGAEYPAQQVLYQLALSQADRSWVDAYQLYQGDVDFEDDAWTYGAETFADWIDKGYIDKDATGVKAEDMGVSFISGKYPIMISGSWWYGRLQTEIQDFEWGTFLFPGSEMTLGSGGNLWVVPENSDAKDLAYDFIDITMSEEIQNILGNNGGVPVAADPAAITDEKSRELISHFQTLSDNDGLAFYPDWPWPGGYDGWVSATQKVMTGDATPREGLDEISLQYQDHVATLPKWHRPPDRPPGAGTAPRREAPGTALPDTSPTWSPGWCCSRW